MTIDMVPNPGGTNGLGWWRYVYLKNGAAPPPPPSVLLSIHADLIAMFLPKVFVSQVVLFQVPRWFTTR